MGESFVTVDEAAELLGIKRATIWKWIKRYDLQRYRVVGDRRSYLKREDIDKLREPQPIKKATAGISPAAA